MIDNKEIKNYVPLNEAWSQRSRFSLTLPSGVESNQILVNTTRIDRLCRLGGINQIRFINEENDEVSSFVPIVVGTNNQGNAYAAKIGLKTSVPVHQSDYQNSTKNNNLPHAMSWIDITSRINTAEIAMRISNDQRWDRNVRSPQAWAYFLDQAAKEAISSNGIHHLTLGLAKHNAFAATIHTLSTLIVSAGLEPNNVFPLTFLPPLPEPLRTVSTLVTFAAMSNTFTWFFFATSLSDNRYRWSLFCGPQFDRALMLKLATMSGSLIKKAN